jgi:hypothetical protein
MREACALTAPKATIIEMPFVGAFQTRWVVCNRRCPARLIKFIRRSKLFAGWSDLRLGSGRYLRESALSAKQVECRLAAILTSEITGR